MLADLFHADPLSRKHLTDIDFASLVTDAAARRDDGGPVMAGVFEFLELAVGPALRLVATRRRLHVERLVWPLMIEAVHKCVEAHLLLEVVDGSGFGRLGFQREVHPLVSPILFRMARRNALERNAEP